MGVLVLIINLAYDHVAHVLGFTFLVSGLAYLVKTMTMIYIKEIVIKVDYCYLEANAVLYGHWYGIDLHQLSHGYLRYLGNKLISSIWFHQSEQSFTENSRNRIHSLEKSKTLTV